MINTLPFYVYLTFAIAVIFVFVLFHLADNKKKGVIICFLIWGVLQSIIALSGFYEKTMTVPPRLLILMLPMMVIVLGPIFSRKLKDWMASLDIKYLTWLHIVRVPVELTLFWLYVGQFVPELMTFEGRNFDILAGLTAPVVVWLGLKNGQLNKTVFWIWNIASIVLLVNILVTAVLSIPTVFQQFGFDQPNTAVYKFPFILIPGVIVPMVLIANIAAFIILRRK